MNLVELRKTIAVDYKLIAAGSEALLKYIRGTVCVSDERQMRDLKVFYNGRRVTFGSTGVKPGDTVYLKTCEGLLGGTSRKSMGSNKIQVEIEQAPSFGENSERVNLKDPEVEFFSTIDPEFKS